MGALQECHFLAELDAGLRPAFLEDGEEGEVEPRTGTEFPDAIEGAVGILLQGLGEDLNREGLKKTPLRVAKALREGTRGYRQKANDIVLGALFPTSSLDSGMGHAEQALDLVVVRDIDLFSYCESCLLPFRVVCHIGYVPSRQQVVGLSKLPRVLDVFAKRLQHPQRLADEVCSALHNSIKPAGVAVALQCWHIQLPEAETLKASANPRSSKFDKQGWLLDVVCSSSGVFRDQSSKSWVDFKALAKFRGVNIEENHLLPSPMKDWCPLRSKGSTPFNGHSSENPSNGMICSTGDCQTAMIAAVTSILQSLGENPLRKELAGTPYRFVQWLMKFKRANLEINLNSFVHISKDFHKTTHQDLDPDVSVILSEVNLPFYSQCEHHLLPFHGVAHIGYFDVQGSKAIERSILQSIVHFYGCKLQMQERLTRQIAEMVYSTFGRGVMVVVEANHTCMMSRGIEKMGSSTSTISLMGQFSTDSAAKESFLQTISNSTTFGG